MSPNAARGAPLGQALLYFLHLQPGESVYGSVTMPRQAQTVFAVVLCFLCVVAIEPTAHAQDASCKKLRKGDKASCQKEVDKSCAGITDYWGKVHCESAIAEKRDGCTNGKFAAACEPAAKLYWEVCRKASELDMNKVESVAAWSARVLGYPEARAQIAAFDKEWAVCYGEAAKSCQAGPGWVADCERAGDEIKTTFAKEVEFYLGSVLTNDKNRIKLGIDSKDTGADAQMALAYAEHVLGKIDALIAVNQAVPLVRTRPAELAEARQQIVVLRDQVKQGYEAKIAARRCPKGKHDNAKRKTALRPFVEEFFKARPDTEDGNAEIKVFRLNGKLATRNPSRLEVEESVPAIVCTQKQRGTASFCQSFNLTLRRTKTKGQSWGDWKVFVGSSQELLCSNLK